MHDNRWAKRIARVYRDIHQLDKAVAYAVQAVYVDPYDMDAHELLADLYEKSDNVPGASREKKTMAILEDWGKTGSKEAERATNPG